MASWHKGRNIMKEGHSGAKLLSSCPGSQEVEQGSRAREEETKDQT